MTFLEKLLTASRRHNSLLCVGLDPELERIPAPFQAATPEETVLRFCHAIIEATAEYACAFKPNLAFFEVLGSSGMQVFQQVVQAIPSHLPVIADGKRGDIGNTARNYAAAVFERYHCDAITVNPYQGYDSAAPFLSYQDKGVFLLCRTSNPSARDFQDLPVQGEDGQLRPLYQVVAQRIQSWNSAGNCGLVAGATYPEDLRVLRSLCPEMPFLIPGVGAQGGDLQAAIAAGVDKHGERAILAISRGILYAAAKTNDDPVDAAREQARSLRDQINRARNVVTK